MQVQALDKGVVYLSGNRIFSYCGWPTIGKLDDGTLVAVTSGHRNWHVDPFGKVLMLQSRDEGKTWSEPTILIDSILDNRDAGFLNMGGGNLIVTSFTSDMESIKDHLVRYDTHLHSFNKLISAYIDMVDESEIVDNHCSNYRVSRDNGFTWSELKVSPVTCPHGPALLSDGSVLYVGNPMFAGKIENDAFELSQLSVFRSTDNCESFTYYSHIPVPEYEGCKVDFCEPHALELPDGTILCHIRVDYSVTDGRLENTQHIKPVYQSISRDGGRTFSVAEPLDFSGSPPFIMNHSSKAVISTYAHRSDPCSVQAAVSLDMGISWESNLVLDDFPETWDMGYASTVEISGGDLFTLFYCRDTKCSSSALRYVKWRLVQ